MIAKIQYAKIGRNSVSNVQKKTHIDVSEIPYSTTAESLKSPEQIDLNGYPNPQSTYIITRFLTRPFPNILLACSILNVNYMYNCIRSILCKNTDE